MESRIRRIRRSVKGLSVVVVALFTVACGCPSAAGPPSTGPLKTPIEPNARAGQIVLPPGNAATLGPLSRNPSTANGVHLSVVTSLLDDTPVFNGDFADPSALPDDRLHFRLLQQHRHHALRSRRSYSGDRAARGFRVRGSLSGRRPAGTPDLDGPRIPVAAICMGEAGRHLRAVLRHARRPSTRLCVQLPYRRVRTDHHTIEFGHVHLEGDELQSFGPLHR